MFSRLVLLLSGIACFRFLQAAKHPNDPAERQPERCGLDPLVHSRGSFACRLFHGSLRGLVACCV